MRQGKPKADEDKLAAMKANIDKDFEKLTAFLKFSGGDYLTGDTFTIADSNAFCTSTMAVHVGLHNMDKFPELQAWYN